MNLFTAESRLSEIIFAHPEIITVINRFGIYLGVSDASVREICDAHGLECDFFLTIINTYLNKDYFPEDTLKSFSIGKIVGYLSKSDNHYHQFQLPNIERHFNSLIHQSEGDNSNLNMLKRFFMEMKHEFNARINSDLKELLPRLEQNLPIEEEQLRSLVTTDISIEDKIHDLASFFVLHLKGDYDSNLCYAVVSAVFALERDVKQDNRIRHRILLPLLGYTQFPV